MDLAAEVPEKPGLAPGIKLAGEMKESAFEQPPWLIERQGQGYIQVPRPLYDVAQHADGEHTLSDIARKVGEADGLRLSTENVRRLIARQLIPNGVIPTRDGKVFEGPTQQRSALAIKPFKTVQGAALAGLTGILQFAFWPPVLIICLLAATALLVWLYAIHGVGAALHDALYFPGFLPLLFLAIVLSAGFHELGHAAALRYGGGTARSFGVGMYLMYPVFFTDVSDNYRLRRWARVRTDLAGFYFNILFAFGVFIAYWLTRQEALLVIVLVMNFDIIRQLMPFVRLDGYWTLADLTGVPDFMSKMGAFVRGMLPSFITIGNARSKLPTLKWWAQVVFIAYILVAIPAMLALLVLTIRNVPRVLLTAWASLGQQGASLMEAASGPDVLRMAGAVGQSILILIPVAGLLYSLYRIGNAAIRWGWYWSEGSKERRGVFGAVAAAVAVLIYAMWSPQFPWPGHGPSPLYSPSTFEPIRADERLSLGDALGGVIVTRPDAAPARTAGGPGGGSSVAGGGSVAAGGGSAAIGGGSAAIGGGAAAGGGDTGSAGGASGSGASTDPGAPGATSGGVSLAGAAQSADVTGAAATGTEAAGDVAGSAAGDAADVLSRVSSTGAAPAATAVTGTVPGTASGAADAVPTVASTASNAASTASGTLSNTASTPVAAVATAVGQVGQVSGPAVTTPPLTSNAPSTGSGATSAVATAVPAAVATAVPAVTTQAPAVATQAPAVATQVPAVATEAPTAVATLGTVLPTAVATDVAAVGTPLATSVPTPQATALVPTGVADGATPTTAAGGATPTRLPAGP